MGANQSNPGWPRALAAAAVLAAAYVILGRLTFAVSVEYGNVTSVVFAPEGVALAFCILFGPRAAIGIFVGQTILSIWSGPSVLGGACIGLFNSLEGVLGVYLFRRLNLSRTFDKPRDAALFVSMVFLVLQPISATAGVAILWVLGVIPPEWIPTNWEPWWIQGLQRPLPSLDYVPSAWVHWWLGNSVGQILVAPMLLAWGGPVRPLPRPKNWDLAVSAAGVAAIIVIALGNIGVHPLLLVSVTYPLLVWIGLQRGIRGFTTANALAMPAVIWAGSRGTGMLTAVAVAERLAYVGYFIATASIFTLVLYSMFEERRVLIQRLTELASMDPLVPMNNRRFFLEGVTREIAVARRQHRPLAYVMFDIDHFKKVNDQHGHATGDDALKFVADCCLQCLRETDSCGRLGGEEFAMALANTDLAGGVVFAERLRNMIDQAAVPVEGAAPLHLTSSFGVSTLQPGMVLKELMEAADEALYRAKRTGRNKVCTADENDAATATAHAAPISALA